MGAALAASVLMAAVVLASPAWAATYTVTNTNNAGAGSLRRAINEANTTSGVADTITFDLGSAATIPLTSAQLPTITDGAGLTINGGSADITISGHNQYRVFEVGSGAKLTLSNLTVANGADAGDFSGGGGIYNQSGTVTVRNSTISGNSNGGISNSVGTVRVSNSTISGNSGAGISTNQGTLTVSNSTISGNSAVNGAGILASDGTVTVRNSTISGNSADDNAGGIYNGLASTLEVSNSTISGNSADPVDGTGGGIYNVPGDFGAGTFKNTIVAANSADTAPDTYGDFISQGHNLIGESEGESEGTRGFTNGQNGDQVGTAANPIDPRLGPLANNGGPTMTHALLAGSPAIDKAVAVEGITTDQRGVARPQGAAPDIGSFELEDTNPMVRNTNPANGATLISPGTFVTATFSKAMDARTTDGDPSTINATTFKLVRLNSDGTTTRVSATVSYSASSQEAFLNPASNLSSRRTYKATVTTGAQDLAGNALDQNPNIAGNQPKNWKFKVQ